MNFVLDSMVWSGFAGIRKVIGLESSSERAHRRTKSEGSESEGVCLEKSLELCHIFDTS